MENFRSFKTRQTLQLEGDFAILIGPNGGGKTNLFDALAIFVRKILIDKQVISQRTMENGQWVRKVQGNSQLSQIQLERHNDRLGDPVFMAATIEATENDILGIKEIMDQLSEMDEYTNNIQGWSYDFAREWSEESIPPLGWTVELTYDDRGLVYDSSNRANTILIDYLRNIENHKMLREEISSPSLAFPFLFLPTSRSRDGVPSNFEIVNFDIHQHKANSESATSKGPNFQLQYLAVSRLGTLHRATVDREGGSRAKFDKLPEVRSITKALKKLGYTWDLIVRDRNKNAYEFEVYKDGRTIRLDQASSGEKEVLSHIVVVNGLNIRGALILIDEPELHLHPSWQKSLQNTLEYLASQTDNQFVLATHSATFVTPRSIANVSRCYMRDGGSMLQRLKAVDLPDKKQLFAMVNALNNEKIFFAERILLVEGLSDEIVMDKIRDYSGINADRLELVRVGGKGQFKSFSRLLGALEIQFTIMADFDYLKQVGSPEVLMLFQADKKKVEEDVLMNCGSRDGARLFDLIDKAINIGDWTESAELWQHICATRLGGSGVTGAGDNAAVKSDLARLRAEGCHLLKRGEIEDYLPEGFQSKDLGRLIELTSSDTFLERLDREGREELESIVSLAIS